MMQSGGKIPSHFEGKTALEHVIDARLKGLEASREVHGAELPGHYGAAADAGKETAFLLSMLFVLFEELGMAIGWDHGLLIAFGLGWALWKVGRSAILGWARLERLHRLIEEERWEIEHHRAQEREEIKAMYATKGLEGKMLEEVTDVLMADDNRLLQVMLEEELGLRLEAFEHPLKQAMGAGIGVLAAGVVVVAGSFAWGVLGALGGAAFVIAFSAALSAKLERNRPAVSVTWNLAVGALAILVSYFMLQLVK